MAVNCYIKLALNLEAAYIQEHLGPRLAKVSQFVKNNHLKKTFTHPNLQTKWSHKTKSWIYRS